MPSEIVHALCPCAGAFVVSLDGRARSGSRTMT